MCITINNSQAICSITAVFKYKDSDSGGESGDIFFSYAKFWLFFFPASRTNQEYNLVKTKPTVARWGLVIGNMNRYVQLLNAPTDIVIANLRPELVLQSNSQQVLWALPVTPSDFIAFSLNKVSIRPVSCSSPILYNWAKTGLFKTCLICWDKTDSQCQFVSLIMTCKGL